MRHLTRAAALGGIIAAALFAAAPSYSACTPQDINGSAMPAGTAANRTVTVTPKTKSVAVEYGETVKFVGQGGREVIWKFDGIANKVTVPDVNVPVYVNQSKSPTRGCD